VSTGRFTGKQVVVTGAGSGIGRATAQRLCDEGGAVIGVDRAAHALEQTFAGRPSGRGIVVDLVEPGSVAEVEGLGDADALVNAAGVLIRHPVLEHPLADWETTLAVNVVAPYRLCREFARGHVASGRPGAIVNVCSIESFTGAPGHAAYTASKTALLMLTRSFAAELADRGIRVNGIAPGVTATAMNEGLRADEDRAGRLLEQIPMRRFGRPEDQAAAICFLLSDDAEYVTGSVLAVDGGWLSI
jgi:NAD(P)-dependent dehydrogenase (short-subunit alcohol dehydrogenase family)